MHYTYCYLKLREHSNWKSVEIDQEQINKSNNVLPHGTMSQQSSPLSTANSEPVNVPECFITKEIFGLAPGYCRSLSVNYSDATYCIELSTWRSAQFMQHAGRVSN
jgi:hypothetical protein